MKTPHAYQVDRTRIIFEQFEDETVLIDTQNSYYYSISPSGTEILHLLEDGCFTEDLATALFGDTEAACQHQQIVANFAEKLKREAIVVERAPAFSELSPMESRRPPYPGGLRFTPPQMERFEEVRDLLMIDPIHQVDQNYGWPKAMGNR